MTSAEEVATNIISEHDGLLDSPARPRPLSLSGHTSLHSDEDETTDPEMDETDHSSDSRKKSKKKPKRKKKRSKDGSGTDFQSILAPTEQNKTPTTQYKHDNYFKKEQRKKFLYIAMFWCIMLAGLITLIYHFTRPTKVPSVTAPKIILTTDPTTEPTMEPTLEPTIQPTSYPSNDPTSDPTLDPTNDPTKDPTMDPTKDPTVDPTQDPTLDPTSDPTVDPTIDPTQIPTNTPSIRPTLSPTPGPTIQPTISPSFDPTTDPTMDPSVDPTFDPTFDPTLDPTSDPTVSPTTDPTSDPSKYPTNVPTTDPSVDPTSDPTKVPSVEPSISPSKTPSESPTSHPSNQPTSVPSAQPTASPILMIYEVGNTIEEQGITMTFPAGAFPDSWLLIEIGEANAITKAIFDDTTSGFQAMSIENIKGNAIHFTVENMPISTDVSYVTTIPIPSDLITECPSDYGYEIFTQIDQVNFGDIITPIFVLFESTYDPTTQTLETQLLPEMFKDFQADIILSCTPGVNVVPVRRRMNSVVDNIGGIRRRLLQTADYSQCKATPIVCPIESKICDTLKGYGRDHYGIDFAPTSQNVIAAADGIIERSATSSSYLELIIIRHDDGSATVYGNLLARDAAAVEGVTVTQGTVIATIDSHLHFEYIPNGKIYATKKRINVANCLPENPTPTASPAAGPPPPTFQPSRSPLVPPSTHPPTNEPTPAPVGLPQGSITVRDSGRLADDSFAVWIDVEFRVCETEIGQLNTCAINFLRPGLHTLTLEVLVAPDGFGTWMVTLHDGWTFTDGTTSKDVIDDYPGITPPVGWMGSWDFIVPNTANDNAVANGNVTP